MSIIDPFNLPFLPLAQRKALPRCSAIYFVIANKQIIYIGSTENLNARWSTHSLMKKLNEIDNIYVAWFECNDVSLLPLIENKFIKALSPVFNIRQAGNRSSGSGSGNLSWGYASANSTKKKPTKQLYLYHDVTSNKAQIVTKA